MLTTTSSRLSCTSGERQTSSKVRRPSPRRGRGVGRELTATQLTPLRLHAYEDGLLPSDLPLSRLLRMSLHSLRGYLEIMDLGHDLDWVTFAEVMVRQRYAQCRQLAGFVQRYRYSAGDNDWQITSLRVAWIRALAELDQGNIRRFVEHVTTAEQMLEDACLETAMEISCDSMRDLLHGYAVNTYGVQERIEELLTANQ